MKQTRSQLEALFANGQRPTGQDFADLFASFYSLADDTRAPHAMQCHAGVTVSATGGAIADFACHIIRPAWTGRITATVLAWSVPGAFDIEILDSSNVVVFSSTVTQNSPRHTVLGDVTGTNPADVLTVKVTGTVIGAEIHVEAIMLQFSLT